MNVELKVEKHFESILIKAEEDGVKKADYLLSIHYELGNIIYCTLNVEQGSRGHGLARLLIDEASNTIQQFVDEMGFELTHFVVFKSSESKAILEHIFLEKGYETLEESEFHCLKKYKPCNQQSSDF